MKRLLIVTSLLVCFFCTIQAKEEVIKKPPVIVWNTSIEIDKIVKSDTATIVHIKASSRPNDWVKIATGSFLKDDNGTIYPIRRGIGITLDKEFYMPASGEAEFQLIFPPLPETISAVDFSEGDFNGSFKIWGIQLKSKTLPKLILPKGVTVVKVNKNDPLPTPVLQYGKATLKGKILDYKKDMFNEISIYIHNPLISNETKPVKIEKDGTFHAEIELVDVTPATLMLPYAQINCILAPQKEVNVTINTREYCRRESKLHKDEKAYGEAVYFSGYLAGLQQELEKCNLSSQPVTEDHKQFCKDIDGKSMEEYKDYIMSGFNKAKEKIEKSDYSRACKEIMTTKLELSTVEYITQVIKEFQIAHVENQQMNREQAIEYFKKSIQTVTPIPDGYYAVLKDFAALKSPKAAYCSECIPIVDIFSASQELYQMLNESLNAENNTLSEKVKAFRLIQPIDEELIPLTVKQKEILKTFSSPAYVQMIEAKNNNLLKKLELNKQKTGFTINEVGEVSNENLFSSILSKFKGHTLLVDFWATWCGPCRLANKEMIPLKEELKDKNIRYIYITGETSPKDTWENMIADIHGEHFRVTNDQWDYLEKQFNIKGVPTYLIIDKEGNICFQETAFPGTDKIKEELMKALNK